MRREPLVYLKEGTAMDGHNSLNESQWRRLFRQMTNLPFRAVGLKVFARRDEPEGWR